MTDLEFEDVKRIAELPYEYDKLTNKTILVSGGTGFIGSFFCDVIKFRNKKYNQNIKIICLSRHNQKNDETVKYIAHDINNPINLEENVDIILHLASNTHPAQYKNNPVGTITTNVFGAYNLLEFARQKQVDKFILASSCEVYGDGNDEPMNEKYFGYLDCNTARAGYNESKRLCESLCQSFTQQYNVWTCAFRMARVFGADRTKKDSKAMAQFIDNAINGKDIVLKSFGNQKYSYIYIADAVSGILSVLLNGDCGEVYNISADYDNNTLSDYANYIAKLSNTKVIIDIVNDSSVSKSQNSLLDNTKVKGIGFSPLYSVCEGIERTLKILKNNGL